MEERLRTVLVLVSMKAAWLASGGMATALIKITLFVKEVFE